MVCWGENLFLKYRDERNELQEFKNLRNVSVGKDSFCVMYYIFNNEINMVSLEDVKD